MDGTYTITATQAAPGVAITDSGDSSQTEAANVDSLSSAGTQLQVAASLAVFQIPVNAGLGGNVTVSFSGNQVEVYNNLTHAVLSSATFHATDTVQVDCPAGQANSVSVDLPNTASAPLPLAVSVQGDSGDPGGYNTLDFSHDTAGVDVNLNFDKGQAQAIAPWNTTLSISGVIADLNGTEYADVLTGGPAAVTEIRGGLGNNTITGGSGDNILLGGGGDSTIHGGPDKNLIIGRGGNCTIYASGSQNIVFAGTTNIDFNDQALLNLLEQGSRAAYGYSARRLLASAANSAALLSTPILFQDTGAHDTIFGSNINNWFVLGKYTTVQS